MVGHSHSIIDVSGLQLALDGKQPSGNYALSSHNHTSSNITDFNSSVSGLLPTVANSGNNRLLTSTGSSVGINAESDLTFDNGVLSISGIFPSLKIVDPISGPSLELNGPNSVIFLNANQSHTIDSTGGEVVVTADSGIYLSVNNSNALSISNSGLYYNNILVSISGHTHTSSNITDFNSTVSGLLPTITGSGYVNSSLTNNIYTISVSGLQPSGNYSTVGHSHVSSDITNFDTSVSGLLPVKNILAGYDINITNNSGVYTVASTNLVHVDSQQPQGFVNRTDSRISVSGNIFKIEPTGLSYSIYNKGIKVTKTSPETITIPSGLTQINYIHFNTNTNLLDSKTTPFDFNTDIPIAYIAWNGGINPSGQMTFFAEERHGIVMDTSTHKWIHNTFGMQYVDGLSISNYILGGNGSSNSHATISIGGGTLYQEDIEINITDSSSTDPFCQELSPIAQIPVYYHQGTTGQWVKNTATDYPVKYGANGPQYNLLTGDNWTTPDVSPGGATRYFAVWILATNQIDDPIISIMGQRVDSNQGSAESNNSWADVNLTNLPLSEVKPIYRLIFAADSNSYTNVPKCRLCSILDIRVAVISTIAGVTQNDHGNLFGLGDDDHDQYVHIDNARTIDAVHTFTNGLNASGLISGTSGNFSNNLYVGGIPVSASGHNHTSVTIYSNSGDLLATSSSGIHHVYIFKNNAVNSALILPPASNGSIYTIKNQTDGTIYIKTSNSETIDDYQPSPLPSGYVIGLNRKYSSISVISDQDNPIPQWIIV